MANVIDLQTEDNLQYNFYPAPNGAIQFKVRAANDAHIALTTGPHESDPMYEIFIGGWVNSKSVIRKNRTKPDKAEADTPGILNSGEFRGFWIRWDSGIISAGRDGEAIPFISWQDPQPFPIGFVGVCTGWGASGTWKIEDSPEFDTPDKLEYRYGPTQSGSLEFEYRGPHNCHICLTSAPTEIDPMYEIIIGGWENSQSVIRHCRRKPDKVTVPTPGIVHPEEFRKFLIQWRCGRLAVRDGRDGAVIMEWTDPAPFPITHFGVRSAWGARGHWKIRHFYTDSGSLPAPAAYQGGFPGGQAPGGYQGGQAPGGYPGGPAPGGYPGGPAPGGYPGGPAPGGYPGGPAPGWNAGHPPGGAGIWTDANSGQVPPGATAGGHDVSGEPLYVVRAQHEGAMIPGKLVASHGCAYVPWGGQEHGKSQYQVLVGGPGNWVRANQANIPPGAFPGGETEDGEPLYIGRVQHEGSLTTGKVQQSHGVCYISFGGQELGFQEYEVLMSN